jgi:type II secretory ATPase GspE/PulE/Tfp pilus assembly ATPase PilB-like protein
MATPVSRSSSGTASGRRSNLGEILIEVGVISQDQLTKALAAADGSEKDLAKWLIDLGFTTEEKIMKGIGIKAKVPYFTSLEGLYTAESSNIISEELARRLQVVPLFKIDNVATVAMVNPLDVFIIDTLVKTSGFKIDPVVCMRTTIFETINKLYGGWESSQVPLQALNLPVQDSPSPAGEADNKPTDVATFLAQSSSPVAWPAQPQAPTPLQRTSETASPTPAPLQTGHRPPEENLNRLVDSLRTKMPEQKMSQMDIIQRDIQKTSEDMPIVQLVDAIFRQAVAKKASDIHIEPYADHTEVRYRIDGVLRPVMTVPKEFETAITSRIKVMANLDITETRQPQDGRVMTEVTGRPVDLRISTLPIIHGEKTVIRILDKGAIQFELKKLGFEERATTLFTEALEKPNGIILVTGPTGSGKSTTLYTGLTILNAPDTNIVTLEDPVEIQIPRINQVQVNTKVGLTFAKGLRSILRQDPDVIMVGEIRDQETGEIAIQAALTGHLVLSTLHTNDAPSAITRLRYMRVEPFLISASLLLVIAQRLVRVLCPNCKEAYEPPAAVREKLETAASFYSGPRTYFNPKGCEACNQTGFKGRKGLYEIFKMTTRLRELVVDPKTSLEEIRTVVREDGMRSLFEEGAFAVMTGSTSVEEMMRVCTLEE